MYLDKKKRTQILEELATSLSKQKQNTNRVFILLFLYLTSNRVEKVLRNRVCGDMIEVMSINLVLIVVFLLGTMSHCARVTLLVAPDGFDLPCGVNEDRPCSLEVAIHAAPAHTTLSLRHGVYSGGFRITTPLTILGERFSDRLTVMDGGGLHRPLTFDNVPAHVDGVTFVNGVGEGAGCVLVSLLTNRVDEVNNITRCSFINCTGIASEATTDVAGGAVSVTYVHSIGASYELNRVHMTNNFGRSKSTAAGGTLIRYGAPTGSTAAKSCNTLVLQVTSEQLQPLAGVYQKLRGISHGGHPVYKSTRLGNPGIKNAPLQPYFVAYCPEKMIWSIFQAPPGVPTSEVIQSNLACHNPTASTVQRYASEIFEGGLSMIKWITSSTGNVAGEPIRFICQDSGKLCPVVEITNSKDAQSHRNGVFYRTNVTRGGRPSFKKVLDGERQQWLWYCPGAKEWIVSDDDPEFASDTQKVCSRGIATLETLAVHPLHAPQWRYWDLDTWRTSTPAPSGIHVRCRPPMRDVCSVVEVVNHILDSPAGPFIVTNFSWNAKPTYKLAGGDMFMWHCGIFSEWVISETNPRHLVTDDESCSRALSSHPTHAFTPSLSTSKWAHFVGEEWKPLKAPLAIRCIDDCPRLLVNNVPRDLVGIYDAVARFNGSRVYYKERPTAFIIFDDSIDSWRMTTDLKDPSATMMIGQGGRLGNSPHKTNIFLTSTWTSTKDITKGDQSPPHLSCDIHRHCSRIEITFVPGTRALHIAGLWLQQPTAHARRPFYAHSSGSAFMFYCPSFNKWVIGPDQPTDENTARCPSWFASRVTASTHPLKDTDWVLVGDGHKWEALPSHIKMSCAGDPDEPDSVQAPTSTYFSSQNSKRLPPVVTDSITECNFTGNLGLSHTSSGAGGAVAIHYGRTAIAPDPSGAFRKFHASSNEAASTPPAGRNTQSAGAVLIHNDYEHRTVFATFLDGVIVENRGDTGGIGMDAVKGAMSKVQLVRNVAFSNGGAMHLRYRSNVSATGCTMRSNLAQRVGGLAVVSSSSSLHITKSELSNNSAHEMEGTTILGGYVTISDSKILGITHSGVSGCFLQLSSSELSCGKGTPSSLTNGFGCLPDSTNAAHPAVFTPAPMATPQVPPAQPRDMMDALWTAAIGMGLLFALYYIYQKWSEQPTKKQRR